jgi:acyl carrier protein
MPDPLIELFSTVLHVDSAELSDESSPDNCDKWDSLAAMRLVAALEESFSVHLSTREIMKMASIGLARSTLQGKGVDI